MPPRARKAPAVFRFRAQIARSSADAPVSSDALTSAPCVSRKAQAAASPASAAACRSVPPTPTRRSEAEAEGV
eukprot:4362555-Pleurochrysis_carterae.AAC.1